MRRALFDRQRRAPGRRFGAPRFRQASRPCRRRPLRGSVIVTANLDERPRGCLSKRVIEAQQPDDFVRNLIDFATGTVCNVVSEQASSLRSPPRTVEELLQVLERNGLAQSVARLRRLLPGDPFRDGAARPLPDQRSAWTPSGSRRRRSPSRDPVTTQAGNWAERPPDRCRRFRRFRRFPPPDPVPGHDLE